MATARVVAISMKSLPFFLTAIAVIRQSVGRDAAFVTPKAVPRGYPLETVAIFARKTCVMDKEVICASTYPLVQKRVNGRASEEDFVALKAQRDELKRRLLSSADEYMHAQDAWDRAVRRERALRKGGGHAEQSIAERKGHVFRVLVQMVMKMLTWDNHNTAAREKRAREMRKLLESDAFAVLALKIRELKNNTLSLAEELSKLNPTPVLTYGWKGYAGGDPWDDCKLGGIWKLRFTTSSDSTFPEASRNVAVRTSQDIDPVKGTLTTVVKFEGSRIKGFRIVNSGEATSDNQIKLALRRIVVRRQSRFPLLFGNLAFPVETELLSEIKRFLSKRNSSARVPLLHIRYLDHNLGMHETEEGDWLIQTRL